MSAFYSAPRETIWRMPDCRGYSEPEDRRVLVADDSLDEAFSMAEVLSYSSFIVRTAHTGTDAMAACSDWRPGVVILDLSMPLGDGWETAAAIRALLRDVYLVAHTSFTSQAELERSQRAGFDAYFIKPCDKARLVDLLITRFQSSQP